MACLLLCYTYLVKLVVVSPPRCGSTMFARAISTAAWKLDGIGNMPYAHNKNWVMAKHEHIIFYGNYDDISICSIIRDPLDAISSNMHRWLSGYVGIVVNGVEVRDMDRASRSNELGKEAMDFMDQSIDTYLAYLVAIDSKIDKLIVFTYDQIKNNPVESVSNVLSMFNLDTQDYSQEDVVGILSAESSEKGVLYGEIRKYLEPKLDEVYRLYWKIMEKVSQKQETYPIKLNPVII